MRIVWQDRAESDLDGIAEHIMETDPPAALRVVSAIRDATWMLAEHPGIGRTGRVEGTRELVIPGLPCILPYQVEDRVIRILAVMHTSRKWPEVF